MAALPGNPYDDSESPSEDAYVFSADGEPLQTVEFLLHDLVQAQRATAFELHTANMISSITLSASMAASRQWLSKDMLPFHRDILARLGNPTDRKGK